MHEVILDWGSAWSDVLWLLHSCGVLISEADGVRYGHGIGLGGFCHQDSHQSHREMGGREMMSWICVKATMQAFERWNKLTSEQMAKGQPGRC